MEINELIKKFTNDEKFREEIVTLGKEGGAKAIIEKYDIPYSEDELLEMLNAKLEQSNCDGSVTEELKESFLSLGILCIVHAVSK